jgi:hypothetical protein
MGQTTKRNRARLPSLFGMKFTQVPSQYSNQFAEQTTLLNNSVAFFLDNGTERWRKAVLDNLWRSHIDWHPFGVLEADDYCQNYHWQFGNQLIFINYIFMKKNEFKLLYTNYVKDM